MILRELAILLRFTRRKLRRFFGHNALTTLNDAPQPASPVPAPATDNDAPATTPADSSAPDDEEARREAARKATDERLSRLAQTFQSKHSEREARQQKRLQEKHDAERPDALTADAPSPRQLEFDFPADTPKAPAPPPQPAPTPVPPPVSDTYVLPSLDLLLQDNIITPENAEEIACQKKAIQDTLDSFGIDAEVTKHRRGPRITLFQIQVARGIRVTAITAIANDLCMALAANTLRILAPMPGHDYVGLEVPNQTYDTVRAGASLASPAFTHAKGLLPVILGRNVEGDDIVFDLARAPHLLVAGATGSGKSVCLNNILISLLYRFRPDELQLILVDPKVVELSCYNPLPHLIVPVITDVDLVVLALHWVIDEMMRRYKILAATGLRNLESFNRRKLPATPQLDDDGNPIPDRLPFIVVIIDELADIMLTAKQDVESSLARIAQLSRAVGIHCIVATQRPSVNVITGVIKANFPTRIAFQVSSQVDSRTIIDGKGAESLLGKGDMLFKTADAFRMSRLQGAMVTDQEIDSVVRFCAAQGHGPDSYEVIRTATTAAADHSPDALDDSFGEADDQAGESLLRAAIEIVIRDQKASVSYLQRRLKIGYNKAANLVELLEKRGIIGPQIANLPREIIAQSVEEAMGDEDY